MDRSRVAIIIPAFNEAKTIGDIVRSVDSFGIVVVSDDGSKDNTAQLAINAGAIVVSNEVNQGYDNALNLGFKKAAELDVDVLITFDADGQHPPFCIKKLIEKIESGYEVVSGVRDMKGRLAETIFGYCTKIFYGLNDPLCGLKAYRNYVYERCGHFDSYQSIGTELILFAKRKGYKVGEYKFKINARSDSPRFDRLILGNLKIIRALLIFMFLQIRGIFYRYKNS